MKKRIIKRVVKKEKNRDINKLQSLAIFLFVLLFSFIIIFAVYQKSLYKEKELSGELGTIGVFSGGYGTLDDPYITGICAELNLENTAYILQNNIFSNFTCFNITANNVTLDCNGYWIIGNKIIGTKGIYVNGYNNIKIKNCTVSNFGTFSAGSSCPYVYSWNGTDYLLDSEAITPAILPEYESFYYSRLSDLNPINDDLKIKISEELYETTYLNSIKLYHIEHDNKTEMYYDSDGNFHSIIEKIEPLSCTDKNGIDCIDKLDSDNIFWNDVSYYNHGNYSDNDLDGLSDNKDFESLRNYIVLNFTKESDNVKLLFRTKEFYLQDNAWIWFRTQLEKQNMVDALGLIDLFSREAFIRIYLWNGSSFEKTGFFDESGVYSTPVDSVKMINLSGINDSYFSIMIEGLPGWVGIDSVYADFSPDIDFNISELELKSAVKNNESIMSTISSVDDDYITLDTGEESEFVFRDDMKNGTYFLKASGYYISKPLDFLYGSYEEINKTEIENIYNEKYYVARYFQKRYIDSLDMDNSHSGIHFQNSVNNTIEDTNVLNNVSIYEDGIYFYNVNNSIINNTRIENTSSATNVGKAIDLVNSNDNKILNASLNNNYYGIYLSTSSNDNEILDSIINNNIYGISLSSSSNNKINNIAVDSSIMYGILLTNSSNNTFTDNIIYNCSGISRACITVYESDNNTFDSNNISLSAGFGIWILSAGSAATDNSDNNLFMNTNMTKIANTSVFLDDDGINSVNLNNIFINFTYNDESVENRSELVRKKWYRASVKDANGISISGAYVNIYDSYDANLINLTTDINGLTELFDILEYIDDRGVLNYSDNYTIYVVFEGVEEFSLNVTQEYISPHVIILNHAVVRCGNGNCDIEETCSNCPLDCGGCETSPPDNGGGSSGGGSGGGSSRGALSEWIKTYNASDSLLTEGYSHNLSVRERLSFKIDDKTHYIGISNVSNGSVYIKTSIGENFYLYLDSQKEIDFNKDGKKDVLVKLNVFDGKISNIFIKRIIEEVVTTIPIANASVPPKNRTSPIEVEVPVKTFDWIINLLIIIIVGIFLGIIIVLYFIYKKIYLKK
jgi:parallel beta-helix repeat protein